MGKSGAKKKKALFNAIMIAAILLIAAAGVLAVGGIRGRLGGGAASAGSKTAAVTLTARDKTGSVNIRRDGLAYRLDEGTELRDGDGIETLTSSGVELAWNGGSLRLDEDSSVTLSLTEDGGISAELQSGSAFVRTEKPFSLRLLGKTLTLRSGVFSASAHSGSGQVHTLSGETVLDGTTLPAARAALLTGDDVSVLDLRLDALSSFELESALDTDGTLCFSAAELETLRAEREAARQSALEAQLLQSEEDARIQAMREEAETAHAGDQTGQTGAAAAGTDTASPVCTIEIRCDTVLDHMDRLAEGKSGYVPANGCILATSRLSFEEGETAFDVLRRACSLAGIQLEYVWSPIYSSNYVEGINNLYEKDCGESSGWLFKVNGWFPGYGCSAYKLKDGDAVVFCYSCEGTGADVGAGVG